MDPSKIKAPIQGYFATDDPIFASSGVDALEKKLKDAKVKFEFPRYATNHAFANETRVGKNVLPFAEYNAKAAETAWQRTMAFLDKSLR
jgi:carboxymethylenebutenolidase